MAAQGIQNQRTLVLASNNKHKLQEIRAILGPSWRVIAAQDVAPDITWDETGTTFVENAKIKLKALRPHTAGCILADDSGLCVEALDGKPGVWSSSYSGHEGDHAANTAKLLKDMEGVPQAKRQAYFICVLVFEDESGKQHIYEGKCHGEIATAREGSGGFGYDPIFYLPDRGKMMASLTENQKNEISHRGRAMAQFIAANR